MLPVPVRQALPSVCQLLQAACLTVPTWQCHLPPTTHAPSAACTARALATASRQDALVSRLASNASASSSSVTPYLLSHQRSLFNAFGPGEPKKYSQRRLVGWSPEQFYRVVSDVQHYHRFVPWCQRSVIMKQSPDGKYMEAELEVGFQLLVERYVSQVTLQPPNAVHSRVNDSLLFHHLDSSWTMNPGPTPDSCWLTFNVDFAFSSPLYTHVANMFFSEVVQRMVSAFEGRCAELYGPSSLIRVPPHRRNTTHNTAHTAPSSANAASIAHQGHAAAAPLQHAGGRVVSAAHHVGMSEAESDAESEAGTAALAAQRSR